MQATSQRVIPVEGNAALAAGAGLLAGELAQLFGVQTVAALFGDRLTVRIPLPLFAAMLSMLGPNAKHIYYVLVLIVQGILTALVGVAYWRFYAGPRTQRAAVINSSIDATTPRPVQPSYVDALPLVAVLWLLSAGIVAPALGGGFFGVGITGGAFAVLLSQMPADIAFALVFIWQIRNTVQRSLATPSGTSASRESAGLPALSRRAILRRTLAGAGLLSVGAFTVRLVGVGLGLGGEAGGTSLAVTNAPARIVPPPVPSYPAWTDIAGLTPDLTSPANFYYVSKNLVGDPQVGQSSWRLAIDGAANRPYSLTYDQLRALPKVEQYHTLECISNEVGGNLMSTGHFTGVRLANVLAAADIQPSASELVFYGADGYSDRLTLDQALDPRSLIVYLLDGQPLPPAHGFPARLLIPGLYGMKNGKWLTHLQLSAGTYSGYWEQRGWTPLAHVKMTSRIDTPTDGASLLSGTHWIAGVAYSGANGISRVEVSTNAGHTWAPARLKRPLGDLTWTLWEYPWEVTKGIYTIGVRAIDRDGNVQTPKQAPPLPDGSSGYDAVHVTVG